MRGRHRAGLVSILFGLWLVATAIGSPPTSGWTALAVAFGIVQALAGVLMFLID